MGYEFTLYGRRVLFVFFFDICYSVNDSTVCRQCHLLTIIHSLLLYSVDLNELYRLILLFYQLYKAKNSIDTYFTR